MRLKRVVILRASSGELANQLWNYASIFAFACHHGAELENPSFFEYASWFTVPKPKNPFIQLFFFLPFSKYTQRRTALKRRIWRKMYYWYTALWLACIRDSVVSYPATSAPPSYLPPTLDTDQRVISLMENVRNMYFDGWLFRNPEGLVQYRDAIKVYFAPIASVQEVIHGRISALRKKFIHVVGVHVRQGDYRYWKNGEYLIELERVNEILREYLYFAGRQVADTCFIFTSDGDIDTSVFSSLNTEVCSQHAVADLFLLANTDTVIGSDSTFGAFAAYYGNIPFIVMKKDPIDWKYYQGKETFFWNTYSTMVHY